MSARSEDAVRAQQRSHPFARFTILLTGAGHAVYAVAVAGLGVLLLSSHFEYVWARIPPWFPGREVLACASGALMLLSALGLSWRRTVVPSAATLTLLFLGWLLLLQAPRIIGAPSKEALWAGGGQLATVVAGGWILFVSSASPTEGPGRWLRGNRAVRVACSLYALALPLFGLHHFFDAPGAAEAVPAWLPLRLGWAYLTGAAHIAAGVAILLRIVPRLAAVLEASMVSLFVLLIHVPWVIGAPRDPLQWTMLFVASAIGGAGWLVAGALPPASANQGEMPWRGSRGPPRFE